MTLQGAFTLVKPAVDGPSPPLGSLDVDLSWLKEEGIF